MLDKAIGDPFFSLCEAVESLNGRGSVEQNRYADDLASALALPSVAGSDAHRVAQMGTAATEFQGKVGCLDDLLGLLKAGLCRPVDLRPDTGRPNGAGAGAAAHSSRR